jgi:hypothetical protein
MLEHLKPLITDKVKILRMRQSAGNFDKIPQRLYVRHLIVKI